MILAKTQILTSNSGQDMHKPDKRKKRRDHGSESRLISKLAFRQY